jgi:hypothetical protein
MNNMPFWRYLLLGKLCRIAANGTSIKASLAYIVASFLTDTIMEILKHDGLFAALAPGHENGNNQVMQTMWQDANQQAVSGPS